MKKNPIFSFSVVLLVFSLPIASCSGDKPDENSKTEPAKTEAIAEASERIKNDVPESDASNTDPSKDADPAIPAEPNAPGDSAKPAIAQAAVSNNGPITMAIKLFKFNTGRYPEELQHLVTPPDNADITEKWSGPYLASADGLKDPWGRPYAYAYPGTENKGKFDLWSMGPDGIDRTDDDITNWK